MKKLILLFILSSFGVYSYGSFSSIDYSGGNPETNNVLEKVSKVDKKYNFIIPDSLVRTIVLEINKAVFPSNVNPKDYLSPDTKWGGIHSDNEEIIALAKEITSEYSNDYDKVKAIHDWVATNIYYDYDVYYAKSGYITGSIDVLHNKKTVCSGYANLVAALLRSIGIPCRVVSGLGLGVGTSGKWDFQNFEEATNHAWNEIYVSGKWIIMDATWDSDMNYQNGEFRRGRGLRGHTYFAPTIEDFSFDHRLEPNNDDERKKVKSIREDYIWRYIKYENTWDGYQFYMERYPSGRYFAECKIAAEDYLWVVAATKNTIEDYEKYEREYPSGRYISQCKANKHTVEARNSWNQIRGTDNKNAIINFLAKYNDCFQAEEAKQQLSVLYEKDGDKSMQNFQYETALSCYDNAIKYYNTAMLANKRADANSEKLFLKFIANANIENGEAYMKECRMGKYFLYVYEKLYLMYYNEAEIAYKAKNYSVAKQYYEKVTERKRNEKYDNITKQAKKKLKKIEKI